MKALLSVSVSTLLLAGGCSDQSQELELRDSNLNNFLDNGYNVNDPNISTEANPKSQTLDELIRDANISAKDLSKSKREDSTVKISPKENIESLSPASKDSDKNPPKKKYLNWSKVDADFLNSIESGNLDVSECSENFYVFNGCERAEIRMKRKESRLKKICLRTALLAHRLDNINNHLRIAEIQRRLNEEITPNTKKHNRVSQRLEKVKSRIADRIEKRMTKVIQRYEKLEANIDQFYSRLDARGCFISLDKQNFFTGDY